MRRSTNFWLVEHVELESGSIWIFKFGLLAVACRQHEKCWTKWRRQTADLRVKSLTKLTSWWSVNDVEIFDYEV